MRRDRLSELRVVNPCQANWEDMPGTDQVRHCAQCDKDVFNLSAMPRSDAEKVVSTCNGHMCVRFQQTQDGKLLTRDPSFRDRVPVRARLVLSALAALAGIFTSGGCGKFVDFVSSNVHPAPTPKTPPTTPATVNSQQMVVMGDMAAPPAPAPVSTPAPTPAPTPHVK